MKTEEGVFYNCSQWKVIKEFSQSFPDVAVSILPGALIIKSVNLSDLPGFVVTSENNNSIFISDFKGNQKGYSFNTVVSWVLKNKYLDQRSHP